MKRTVKCSLFVAVLAYVVSLPSVWLWVVFAADYLLGNPGPFGEYRDALFEQEYLNWPIHGKVVPPPVTTINASDYSFESFKILSNRFTQPVLFKGLFKNAKVMQWTPETLINHYKPLNRSFIYVKNNRIGNDLGVYEADWETLENIIANISAGGSNYIHNSNLYYPEDVPLYNEIELGPTLNIDRKSILIQWFLGKLLPEEERIGGSAMHCAGGPNVFIQVTGSKRWTIVDPRYTRYIKPKMFNNQLASYSVAGIRNEGNDSSTRWARFPRWEVILHPGDALFIPGWFWHEVHIIPSYDWNLSIATRWAFVTSLWQNNWLFTLLADLGTQGKPCPRGFRFLCAKFVSFEGGTVYQKASDVGPEAMKKANQVLKIEKDYE